MRVIISGLFVSFNFNVIGKLGMFNGNELSNMFKLILINIGNICICCNFCCVLLIIEMVLFNILVYFIICNIFLNWSVVFLVGMSLIFVWFKWEIIMLYFWLMLRLWIFFLSIFLLVIIMCLVWIFLFEVVIGIFILLLIISCIFFSELVFLIKCNILFKCILLFVFGIKVFLFCLRCE